jgi:hypothetical protein
MATNKRLTELIDYTSVLLYANEMFGIYQPLLGWKSKRIVHRFEQCFQNDKLGLIDKLKTDFTCQVNVHYLPDCQIRVQIRPGALDAGRLKTFDRVAWRHREPLCSMDHRSWKSVCRKDRRGEPLPRTTRDAARQSRAVRTARRSLRLHG